ncbi:unnamed protein product [Fusarium graminearum]|uniref:Uncharacterized protein n=1 Tax=Gibberella zeae TaxID=5518 RepID=A0A4E9DYB1_GIBZA|nr:unnamed protein product [Fusarium graminearum]
MLQLQLMLKHTCFSFGQRELQQELERNSHTYADSVGKIQNVIIYRLNLNFFQLLNTPLYLDAIKPLRQSVKEVLLIAYRDATSIHKEADRKIAEIEAQRERLNLEEQGVKRHRDENLDNIRDSIERGIFTAIGQAKDALPDIGIAENC